MRKRREGRSLSAKPLWGKLGVRDHCLGFFGGVDLRDHDPACISISISILYINNK